MHRPLPDDKQQSQETDIRDHGGIRTRNPSKRAAADRAATGTDSITITYSMYSNELYGIAETNQHKITLRT